MRSFYDLEIWQRSHKLTLDIYNTTRHFPKEELYGLVSQLRRATASIPTNIAEGCGRNTEADIVRFLHISMGSASEVEYELILSRDLGYIDANVCIEYINEIKQIKKMLVAFSNKLLDKTINHSNLNS